MLLERLKFRALALCLCFFMIPIHGSSTGSTREFIMDKNVADNNIARNKERLSSASVKKALFATVSASSEDNATLIEGGWRTACTTGQKFHQRSESFLNYMLRIQFCDIMHDTSEGIENVCQKRAYATNEYYEVAYMRWCDKVAYQGLCQQEGSQTKSVDLEIQSSGEGRDVTEVEKYVIPAHLDEHMVKEACKSVEDFLASFQKGELYNPQTRGENSSLKNYIFNELQESGNVSVPMVKYTEWYFPVIPFCEPFTCGASYSQHSKDPTSVYDCMPKDCKAMISFSIFFDAMLSILTLVANALVLAVAARTKIMRNIPGYFKISLAIADLTVGAFVLPSCIYTTYAMYMAPLPFRHPGQLPKVEDYIIRPLTNFMGFFGILSFSASLYTMAGASLDRYLAITKPFQYRQGQYLTKRRCILAFGLIWSIAFVVAIFPVFTDLPFGVSAFNLIISSGIKSSIVYAAALLVPLLAVWLLNGAMLKQVCADREKRSSIRATSVINAGSPQHSFPKTIQNHAAESPSMERNPSTSENVLEEVPEVNQDRSKQAEVIENGPGTTEKQPVTRNVSTLSTGFQKKRSGISLGDGAIERLKRQRNKQTEGVTQRKSLSRQLSVPNSAASVERRLARTLAIMIGAFTVALLPNIATMIAYIILASDTNPETTMHLASTLYLSSRILLSNSFWNCIIYSIRNRHFRRAMWALFLFKKEKIDRKLRQSISMSQPWKGRGVNGSVQGKQSLSKTSSTASSYGSEKTRRSTLFWSLASNSPCSSRKASSDVPAINKEPFGRTVSCNETPITGILKKTVGRSESAPGTGVRDTAAVV